MSYHYIFITFCMIIFTIIEKCYQHTFIILTKRPHVLKKNIGSLITAVYANQLRNPFPDNLWLGVSIENQRTADKRIPVLLEIPAAIRIISVEPMLERINLDKWLCKDGLGCKKSGWLVNHHCPDNLLNWVICGPETGPGARPFNLDWARDLYNQCKKAGISFFYKGNNPPGDLQVQEGYKLWKEKLLR